VTENTANTLLHSALALAAGFALAATLVDKCAPSKTDATSSGDPLKHSPDDLHEARRIRRAVQQALAPKITWRKQPSVATLRQEMIIAQPFAAYATWAEIDAAENELIQPEIAMLLGNGETFGVDCFTSDKKWPEFTYNLTVRVSPTLVAVGGFKIISDNLPQKTITCLEELFRGEATREGTNYTPFETVAQRQSNFVEMITSRLSEVGRDELLRTIGAIPGDEGP